MARRQFAQAGEKAWRGRDDAVVRSDRFDDNGGDGIRVRREDRLDRGEVVVFGHERMPSDVGRHAGRIGLAVGERAGPCLHQHAVGMAVVAAGELDDVVAPREAASRADRAHDRLGAGRDHAQLLHRRHQRAHEFGELCLARRRRPEGKTLAAGLAHGRDDGRMGVTEDRRSPGADEINVLHALGVDDPATLRRRHEARRDPGAQARAHGRIDPARHQPPGGRV